jgi:hypothetical protein
MLGRVTMFREVLFSGHALHSIGIALDAQYVKASSSAQPNER